MHEYMERELHYSRHTANERLRVANELFELPLLAEQFRLGEMPFTMLRELTRVVVPENEAAWIASAKSKTAAQVQKMVSGLCKGADPGDEPDPALVSHRIWFDVDAEAAAMWRASRTQLDDESGQRLTDSEVMKIAARAVVQPPGGGDGTSAPCLHAVTTCRECKRSTLVAGGMEVPLDPATAERMLCDAVDIGDLESDDVTRARAAIPEATRRKVLVRDKFAGVVPGCRSRRTLDCHHVLFRSRGGSNKPANIATLCTGHHQHPGSRAVDDTHDGNGNPAIGRAVH